MRASQVLWIMILAWLAAYGWSIWNLVMTQPTGFGFTRGLNRVAAFMGWQMAAGGIAVAIWVVGRGFALRSRTRWLSRIPGLLALLLILGIAGLIVYGQFVKYTAPVPSGPSETRPVAEPVN